MKRPLIVLTGPTAVGKTQLSVQLAKAVNGEIISADSMQVYKHMNIGSAKITKEQMEGISHYLVDEISPFEEFNVVKFKQMAKSYLETIYTKGKIPILAGGTGFYIQALLYDIDFTSHGDNNRLRSELTKKAKESGAMALHNQLRRIDPQSADQIHPNNSKRVIRAIEFYYQTGNKISEHNEKERQKESPYNFLYFVLNTERAVLYENINRRVDSMMEQGLLQEVRALAAMGCTKEMVSMKGLGYKEMLNYLDGQYTLEEAVSILKRDTRHFAKRQLTWFQREKEVRWIYLPDYENRIDLVLETLLSYIKKEMGLEIS